MTEPVNNLTLNVILRLPVNLEKEDALMELVFQSYPLVELLSLVHYNYHTNVMITLAEPIQLTVLLSQPVMKWLQSYVLMEHVLH